MNVSNMTIPSRFNPLFDAFFAAGYELVLVGGCVRDCLMGNMDLVHDWDMATDALPLQIQDILTSLGVRSLEVGMAFGTVVALLEDGEQVEITTYRVGEEYTEGDRKPSVVFGRDLSLDLARRDLTINAMAWRKDGLVDPFNGLQDIEDRILRTPGDSNRILSEDALRILRVARFSSRFGFAPSEELLEAAKQQNQGLLSVSKERWFQEIGKLFSTRKPSAGVMFLRSTGALELLLGLENVPLVLESMLDLCDGSESLCWAVAAILCGSIGSTWGKRFRMSSEETTNLQLNSQKLNLEIKTVPSMRKYMESMGSLQIAAHTIVYGGSMDFINLKEIASLNWTKPTLPTGLGTHLGLKPGKELGLLMGKILQAVYDGHLSNPPTIEECVIFAS